MLTKIDRLNLSKTDFQTNQRRSAVLVRFEIPVIDFFGAIFCKQTKNTRIEIDCATFNSRRDLDQWFNDAKRNLETLRWIPLTPPGEFPFDIPDQQSAVAEWIETTGLPSWVRALDWGRSFVGLSFAGLAGEIEKAKLKNVERLFSKNPQPSADAEFQNYNHTEWGLF